MSNNEKPEDLSGIKTARFVFCLKTSDPDNRTQTESDKNFGYTQMYYIQHCESKKPAILYSILYSK